MDLILDDVNRIFDWFGFEAMDNARINLHSEGFTTFTSMANKTEERIASIKSRYGRNGRNDIGEHRMRLDVIGAIYWVQDCHRIGQEIRHPGQLSRRKRFQNEMRKNTRTCVYVK